ncbi:hypothetical protein KUTeg_001614 [Tegillarca granosa]|uniref:Signal recognition particle receptor subunit beta n=1 Tax=Tegillarca granosa TaxID=220873 RepID=A0ABQ9FTH3_TEGGR|nr:hypothetical protein KUTeg_001614 [Tegillarca granosa]
MADKVKEEIFKYVDLVKIGVEKQDPTVLGVLVAVGVVFLTLVLFLCFSRRGNKRSGVLLLGPCDSGKTLMFTRLVHHCYRTTYTSMKPNSGSYLVTSKNKSLSIMDLPGHERVRTQILEQNKQLARGIIYVIDSSTFQKEIKEVAEFLYTILSDSVISNNAPPILVACNKHDLTFVKGSKFIQTQLEKEMNTLRVTRSAALQQIDGASNNNTYLGKRNKDFAFEDLKPIKVEFVECSAQGKDAESEPDLKAVEEWLIKIA